MTGQDNIHTFEVQKGDLSNTRLTSEMLSTELEPDEVLFKIERLALTANNISYATAGDSLGYWDFFPAETGWGRIPAMGWSEVVASRHTDITVGDRYWGWFPMSTHLKVLAGHFTDYGFSDISEHRAEFAPIYAGFDAASANPVYQLAREDHDSLLRALFMTSWLVDDFIDLHNSFGADTCLITSASSKTSIALGHCVSGRGKLTAVGITSPGNIAFCEGLGCYDQVIAYSDVTTLDATRAVVLVDMAGSAKVTSDLHHHYADNMKHSCRIGATHHDQGGSMQGLPGAKPEFFFAPAQVKSRSAELGPDKLKMLIGSAYVAFRDFATNWLRVEQSYGAEEVAKAYDKVLLGQADPASGQVVSMWPRVV